MSLYRFIFLCLCIFFTSQLPVTAQEAEKKVIFEGTILDSKTGETLPVVVIHIKELNMWTTSNLEGAFSFKNIKPGTYTVTASCLGYKDYEMKMVLTKDVTNYKLRLEEVSLAISEVTVTAKSGGKLNSSYSINKTAIEHLQATSLTDIMQLLPGVLTFNPSLTKINQITIRDLPPITNGTAVPNTTNALGTAQRRKYANPIVGQQRVLHEQRRGYRYPPDPDQQCRIDRSHQRCSLRRIRRFDFRSRYREDESGTGTP